MEREIFEANLEFGENQSLKINVYELDLGGLLDVPKNKKGILFLVNGEQFVVEIKNIDDNGIIVSSIGSELCLHYSLDVVGQLYVEL